jgi:phospholipid/cholesterol/gamma-HCH transport system ATP-binding protein
MIRFDKVKRRLGGKTVLDGVSFEIEKGETYVIVGSSGTGKSVTLKHMVRLLTPDEGQVWVGDDVVSEASGLELEQIRSRFGVLFQGGALLQWLTVGDNVGLPLRQRTQMESDDIDKLAREKLELVELEDVFDKSPSDLSGGMQKRAALARAIITDPEIILYDEPTSGLDPVTSRTIDKLIDDLRKNLGVTSVVVTHDLHSALAIGTRVCMLAKGHVVEVSAPEDFIKSDKPEVRSFLESQYITTRGSWEEGMAKS